MQIGDDSFELGRYPSVSWHC